MSSEHSPEFRFVSQSVITSRKDRELEVARLRSHAAKISHQKRRQKQQDALWAHDKIVYYSPRTRSYTILVERDEPDASSLRKGGEVGHRFLRYGGRSSGQIVAANTASVQMSRGNSDPFQAQGIEITPRINQLLTFVRDAYLPGIYITSFTKQIEANTSKTTTIAQGFKVTGRRTATRVWNSMKEELTDEGRALAWVCSYAPVMARYSSEEVSRDITVMAIKMKLRSMRILKDKIGALTPDSKPDIALIAQIVSLFRASCKERDLESAKVHAAILRCLVDRMVEGGDQIRTLFVTLLSNDTEIAVSNMQRTFFDFENWVSKQLLKFWWSHGEANLPTVSSEYSELHSSILISSTRAACIRLRRYWAIRKTTINLNDPIDLKRGDAVFSWVSTYSLYDLGALINVYLNLSEGASYRLKPAQRFAEAGIALTALYLYRWGVHQATIYGGDHRDGMHLTIIARLQSTMRNTLKLSTPQDLAYYQDAFLWIFFYGSRYEYRNNKKTPGVVLEASKIWFSEMFAQQAHLLGVTTWVQVQEKLHQFVFYDFLEQDPEAWLVETLLLASPSIGGREN